jgi:hypothetical protein
VLFLGADLPDLPRGITSVETLSDAASTAVALLGDRRPAPSAPIDEARVRDEASRLAPGQRYVRALYSGGTFRTETELVWRAAGLPPGHTALDLGDDEFTVGRPHPMIDPTLRIERIAQEARDPATAAIVLDVVLGYGAHDDPAGALAPAIRQARTACAGEGRHLPVIAFVCGTDEDPQSLTRQQEQLTGAGAIVLPDSASAARFAAMLANHAAMRRGAAVAQG